MLVRQRGAGVAEPGVVAGHVAGQVRRGGQVRLGQILGVRVYGRSLPIQRIRKAGHVRHGMTMCRRHTGVRQASVTLTDHVGQIGQRGQLGGSHILRVRVVRRFVRGHLRLGVRHKPRNTIRRLHNLITRLDNLAPYPRPLGYSVDRVVWNGFGRR